MRLSILITLVLAGCGSSPRTAKIVQTLPLFHRPESVAFSLDGEHLFVSNCASGLFGPDGKLVGFQRDQGAISKLNVLPGGRVEMARARFVEGLSGSVGLGVLPVSTPRYPAGTLLVNCGIALLVDAGGEMVTDAAALETGIRFFDPDSGKELGRIDLGVGSAVAAAIGHPVLLPNSMAFDDAGNLFVTDTAKGGDRLRPEIAANPGLIRIPHASIDDPRKGGITFTPVPGVPNGVGYWEARDAICLVTMGGGTPEGEAVYVIPAGDFPLGALPEPRVAGVGTADGIAFTKAGTIVTSRFSGDLLAIPERGAPTPITLDPDVELVSPADHRILTLQDGTSVLAVPEQARVEPEPWKQRVRIIHLSPGF